MGVPKFYGQWLRHKLHNTNIQLPSNVYALCIDVNSLIHQSAQIVYSYGEYKNEERLKYIKNLTDRELEDELYQTLGTKLLNIITAVRPTDMLVIAVDGSAPLSKINQQRQRRYKSSLNPVDRFAVNQISPGTNFMRRLDRYIRKWIKSNSNILPAKIIYSSHMVVGEGEQKIYDILRKYNKSPVVVHGLDTDLIMLSLVCPIEDIYLIRDNVILSIRSIKDVIGIPPKEFVLICYLIGNDFIPNLLYLEEKRTSIDTLIDVYRSVGLSLVNGNTINWQNMRIFFTELAKREPDLILNEALKEMKNPLEVLGNSLIYTPEPKLDYDGFRSLWYKRELEGRLEDNGYYKVTDDRIMNMCKQYVTTLQWIYTYYTEGADKVNKMWFYPYFRAPLSIDLIKVDSIGNEYSYEYGPDFINPLYQLVAILPANDYKLLPKPIQGLTKPNSEIYDMYPSKFIIDHEGKEQDWESIAIIPPPEIDRIIEAVDKLVDDNIIKKFEVEDDIIIDNTSTTILQQQNKTILDAINKYRYRYRRK
jgi:5'-3' exoribonuclease 1